MKLRDLRHGLGGLLLAAFVCPVHAELVLTSAPRDSRENEEAVYRPIVELLAKATGEPVRFLYGDNFLIYQSEMRKGTYDIALDGPAFVGWRMAKLGHVPLVKFPGALTFVVIARKDDPRINRIGDLAGRTVCAFSPPNLSSLTILYEFDNPARQPMIMDIRSFHDAYRGVAEGRCVAGILQAKLYQELDKDAQAMKVVFTSKPLPNQAFSASPRVSAEMRAQIVTAMLSPEGVAATQGLRDMFKVPHLLPAPVEEYEGLGRLLRDVWGFEP
jgi:ABC-type phosphate/phosphonate transport system substrate-binding protein